MAKEASIDYDEENDILYVNTGQAVSDSLEFDNFVIDYSKDGMIVGVEIMKAAEFVGKFGLARKLLLEAKKAKFSIVQGKEYALVRILFAVAGEEKEITVPSPAPQMARV